MFLPPEDREFGQVVPTYAHELTHHWVDQRYPRFTDRERTGAGGRGYWVVEGIAEYVSELELDITGEAAPVPNPRAYSVDIVAHAAAAGLHPWSALFELDQGRAQALSHERRIEVPVRWRLGMLRKVSLVNVFYAQASAATHYLLLAEEGRHREAFLVYLTEQYRGRLEPGAIQARFGMPPDEFGARIVAWCRERAGTPGK
jgi:hypothetical protein